MPIFRWFALLGLVLVPSYVCLAAPLSIPANMPDKPGMEGLRAVLAHIAAQQAEIITIQRELVSRPALGPEAGGSGEEDKANWLTGALHARGVPMVERMDSVDRVQSVDPDAKRDVRPNIVAIYPGEHGLKKGRTLWIICHMHVAHPGPLELWSGSPYKLRVEGGRLYGRGVMDNYQSITAAMLLLEGLSKNKLTPPLNLGLVLHAQNSGFRHVLQTRPELFKPDDLYLVPDEGNPEGTIVGVAEKGLLWLKVAISGETRHAADGNGFYSALAAGSELVTQLPEFDQKFSGRNPLFANSASVCTPTQAATSSGGINTIAATYSLYLDCRFAYPQTSDEIIQGVRHLAEAMDKKHGVNTALDILVNYPAAPAAGQDSAIFAALQRAVRAQLPNAGPLLRHGSNTSTAATALREKGLDSVTWGKIEPANRQIANEFAYIADHLDEAGVFARILFDRKIAPTAKDVGEEK